MLTFNQLVEILGDSFFNGDTAIAGMVVFGAVMAIIFAIFGRKGFLAPFALMLPLALIFTSLRIIPETMSILLVIVAVVGLAHEAKDKF